MQYLYRCTACGEHTPSPGRLEGNWCPHCDAEGTIEMVRDGLVGAFSDAMADRQGGPEAGPALMDRVRRARKEAGGDLADALELVDGDTWPILVHIFEEEALVSITDLFRAMGFDTKTETYRHTVKLVHKDLLHQHEGQRFTVTDLGKRAVEAVQQAGPG